MATCYRHSSRETGVSCSSCGRPICPDCMTPTPVGMRCPECARDRTRVQRMAAGTRDPVATYTLIAINVAAFVVVSAGGGGLTHYTGSSTFVRLALFGPAISEQHEYWRLVTSGFMHQGLLHLAFNMYFLWALGMMLEPAIGRLNYVALYLGSLLCGSFGALLFQPQALTTGASGACFGLLGGAIALARSRSIPIMSSGLGIVLILNIAFTFTARNISIGGHVGGLVGGFAAGLMIVELAERRGLRWAPAVGCAGLGVASVLAAVAVAGGTGLTPNGLTI